MDLASQVFPLWLVGQFGKGVGKGEVPRVTVGIGGHSSTQWPQFSASVLRSYQSPVAFSCSTHGETGITMRACMPPHVDAGPRIISLSPFSSSTVEFQGEDPGSQADMNVLLPRSHSLASSICFLSV